MFNFNHKSQKQFVSALYTRCVVFLPYKKEEEGIFSVPKGRTQITTARDHELQAVALKITLTLN